MFILGLFIFLAPASTIATEEGECAVEDVVGIIESNPAGGVGIRTADGKYLPAVFKILVRPFSDYENPEALARALREYSYHYEYYGEKMRVASVIVVYVDGNCVFRHVSRYTLLISEMEKWGDAIAGQHRE